MRTSDFDYDLPEAFIAQTPLRQRDRCKLCVLPRQGGPVQHRHFKDLSEVLKPGDLLVLNDTRVVRARIPCVKEGSGGAMEVFLLDPPGAEARRRFRAFFKPARRVRTGSLLRPLRAPQAGAFKVIAPNGDEGGELEWTGTQGLDGLSLEALGVMPLPPYIKRERLPEAEQSRIDARYYQSVFATQDGSSAAPTASLHFSRALLSRLRAKGVQFAEVTLHVGAGTFLPIKTEVLDDHVMHSEPFTVSPDAAKKIASAKEEGRRIIAVGTTVVRVLESAFYKNGQIKKSYGNTTIFIKPGYEFKLTQALITNFHQPKSTLLALVQAFYQNSKVSEIYKECMEKKYRFLSYGDAMLII